MADAADAHGFAAVALRYFNAAGAWEGRGEDHAPETHLIPRLLRSILRREETFAVFGDDYPPPTAPASATTSTSATWPRPTPGPCCGPRSRASRPSTWAPARGIRCARSSPPPPRHRPGSRSPGAAAPPWRPRPPGGRQRPRPRAAGVGSPAQRRPDTCWATPGPGTATIPEAIAADSGGTSVAMSRLTPVLTGRRQSCQVTFLQPFEAPQGRRTPTGEQFMPTHLSRLFGRGRPRKGDSHAYGLRLAAGLQEASDPRRVLEAGCRLARGPGIATWPWWWRGAARAAACGWTCWPAGPAVASGATCRRP